MDGESDLLRDENRRIRTMRIAADLLVHVLSTRPVTLDEAEHLIQRMRGFALKLFPGKEHAFDLIYAPRFRRALREAGIYRRQPRLRVLAGRQADGTS